MAGLNQMNGPARAGMTQSKNTSPRRGDGTPQQSQPGAEVAPEGESTVSPEEQAQYDEFVTNGMQLAYSPQMRDAVLQNLQGGGNKIQGLASTVVMIVARLDETSKGAGAEISGDVKYHGAVELLEQLAEYAEESGVAKFTDEEVEQSLYLAMDLYLGQKQGSGEIDQASMEADMAEVAAADQAGTLGDLLPGMGGGAV